MTYKEAKERVDCILKNNPFTKADITALALAIESIEKQIPKKPISVKKHYYECPCCKRDLGVSDDDIFVYENPVPKYCDYCGQAIDWSDVK